MHSHLSIAWTDFCTPLYGRKNWLEIQHRDMSLKFKKSGGTVSVHIVIGFNMKYQIEKSENAGFYHCTQRPSPTTPSNPMPIQGRNIKLIRAK